jgi:type II secretory pathway pseudopilin PulG
MSYSFTSGPRSCRRANSGVTLVELLVIIVVLGGMAAVVGLTWRAGRGSDRDDGLDRGAAAVLALRARALKAGTAVTGTVPVEGGVLVIMALPDGRVVGADRLGFDPLSGRHQDAGPEDGPDARTPNVIDGPNVGTRSAPVGNE